MVQKKSSESGELSTDTLWNAERTERRLFTIVIGVGIAALFFGGFHLLNGIRSPFRLKKAEETQTTQTTGQKILALQNKDTDGDSISDYDELYRYKTSPYIEDSDSDGKSDSAELKEGTDPNCPAGQACTPIAAVPPQSTNLAENVNATTAEGAVSATPTLSAAELRTALRNAGVPSATLDAMSDAQLVQLYQDVAATSGETVPAITQSTNATSIGGLLNSATVAEPSSTNTGSTNAPSGQPSTGTATNASTNTPAASVQDLQNLTPTQMRELLKEFGVSEEELQNVDDQTLQTIFQQALEETQASEQ